VHLRFPETKEPGRVTLEMGVKSMTKDIPTGATECAFPAVPVAKGNLRLQATLAFGEHTKGPWQADVFAP
jgi:hypothetical protein